MYQIYNQIKCFQKETQSVDKIAASVLFQNFWILAKHNPSIKFNF